MILKASTRSFLKTKHLVEIVNSSWICHIKRNQCLLILINQWHIAHMSFKSIWSNWGHKKFVIFVRYLSSFTVTAFPSSVWKNKTRSCHYAIIHTKQWLLLNLQASQKSHVDYFYSKMDSFEGLHNHLPKN